MTTSSRGQEPEENRDQVAVAERTGEPAASPGEPSGQTPPGPRRLYRSRRDRMAAGVCGGLGQYFNVDPVLVRLLFVLLTFASGAGLLAYIILAIVVPLRPADQPEPESSPTLSIGPARMIAGLLLVALGLLFLADNLGFVSWSQVEVFWPILLVALGAALLLRGRQTASG